MDTAKVTEQMVNWLREKVAEAGAKGVILGISGGVDSAVVGMIAKRAFPEDTLGVMMPCGSLEEDLEHAMLLVQECGMKSCVVDLTNAFNTMLQGMAWLTEADTPAEKAARSNIKPRLCICGHDYTDGWEGSKRAVEEVVGIPDAVFKATSWGKRRA